MTIVHRNLALESLVSLVSLALSSSPAAADTCKRVSLAVKNNKATTIKAIKMAYKFTNDNQERIENFPSVDVGSGAFKTVAADQNLDGGEGNKLVSLKLYFKALCGGKWSVEMVSAADTQFDDSSACQSNSNRSYRLDLAASDVCNSH